MALSRRALIKSSVAAAGVGAIGFPAIVSRAADTLVVNAFGGEYQEVFVKTTVEPFEKKFGVKITYDQGGMASETYAKIRAARGSPGFDVAAELTEAEILLGTKENLLEKISEAEVPNLKYVWKKSHELIPPYGVMTYYQYLALVWNDKKLDTPESWFDYWAPGKRYGDKVKGFVIEYNPVNLLSVYALIMAARIGGGGTENMAPAWEMLKQQKPYVGTVVTSSAQAAPYLENGQVWISPFWSGRSGWYIEHGYPLKMTVPKEGTIASGGCSAIPIGATNKKLAFEFLNFRLDPEVQHNFSLGYHTSPGRPDLGDWPADFAATQVTKEADMAKLIFVDAAMIGAKRREWTLQWQEIMGA